MVLIETVSGGNISRQKWDPAQSLEYMYVWSFVEESIKYHKTREPKSFLKKGGGDTESTADIQKNTG